MNRREHLMVCAAEEGIEVALSLAQRISKGLRFGLAEIQPEQDKTNAQRIVDKFYDLVGVMRMLDSEGYITLDEGALDRAADAKMAKVQKFIAYSRSCGTLDGERGE
jgi:hypothetical protein